jgi:hypothetical protein
MAKKEKKYKTRHLQDIKKRHPKKGSLWFNFRDKIYYVRNDFYWQKILTNNTR